MIDIDAEFRKAMFGNQTNSAAEPSNITAEDMLADLRRIQRELGPPPPQVHFSRHVPTMMEPMAAEMKPAHSDDMRDMVEGLRDQGGLKRPSAIRIGNDVFVNPVYQSKFTRKEPDDAG